MLELAQHFHFLLQVLVTGHRQALVDIRFQGRLVQRRIKGSWVQQLVQQHRVAAKLAGDPRARRAQAYQLRQRQRAFREQGQIGTASRHRFDDVKHAGQGRQRLGLGSDGAQ